MQKITVIIYEVQLHKALYLIFCEYLGVLHRYNPCYVPSTDFLKIPGTFGDLNSTGGFLCQLAVLLPEDSLFVLTKFLRSAP